MLKLQFRKGKMELAFGQMNRSFGFHQQSSGFAPSQLCSILTSLLKNMEQYLQVDGRSRAPSSITVCGCEWRWFRHLGTLRSTLDSP